MAALIAAAALVPLAGAAQAAAPQAPARSVAAAHPCDDGWGCHHDHWHRHGLDLGLGLGLGLG